MKEGLYRAAFDVNGNGGDGLVVLHQGRVWGGDQTIYYTGSYQLTDDNKITAEITTDEHATLPGESSILGSPRNTIHFTGSLAGDVASLQGLPKQVPGMVLNLKLTFLSD